MTFTHRILLPCSLLVAALLLGGCTKSAYYNLLQPEASADFTQLRTYRWDNTQMSALDTSGKRTPEFDHILKTQVDHYLQGLGYHRVGKPAPEEYVASADAAPGVTVFTESGKIAADGDKAEETAGPVFDESTPADFILDYRISIVREAAAEEQYEPVQEDEQGINKYGVHWHFGDHDNPSYQGVKTQEDVITAYERGTLHIAAFNSDKKMIWHVTASKILDGHADQAKRRLVLRKIVDEMMEMFPVKPQDMEASE